MNTPKAELCGKPTPGPWMAELGEPFTLGGDCREVVALDLDGMVHRGICTFVLDTDGHPHGKDFLEDLANARLIAAAPKLYAATKELARLTVETCEKCAGSGMIENDGCSKCGGIGEIVTSFVHPDEVKQARRAIAEVDGLEAGA